MKVKSSFKGLAKPLDNIDLPKLGHQIGVGEDEIHAFLDVETRGSGFDNQGRPRILFERHKFYKYLPANKRDAGLKSGLANKRAGGYGKESTQYSKLKRAMKIDSHAALMACSWGLGQVMGFNHKFAGFASVEHMVNAFLDDEEAHLQAAVNFIKNTGLDDELRRHDWAGFAKGYNGSGYRRNRYDEKLAEAFAKWQRIRDTPYNPDAAQPPQPDDPGPVEKKIPGKGSGQTGVIAITGLAGLIGVVIAWWEQIVNWIGGLF